jgi:hypothetical protein
VASSITGHGARCRNRVSSAAASPRAIGNGQPVRSAIGSARWSARHARCLNTARQGLRAPLLWFGFFKHYVPAPVAASRSRVASSGIMYRPHVRVANYCQCGRHRGTHTNLYLSNHRLAVHCPPCNLWRELSLAERRRASEQIRIYRSHFLHPDIDARIIHSLWPTKEERSSTRPSQVATPLARAGSWIPINYHARVLYVLVGHPVPIDRL